MTNGGRKPLTLRLRGRPIAFDVIVATPEGVPVWRRLEGRVIPAIEQVRTLRPGTSLELRERWDQRDRHGRQVSPGAFTVTAILPTLPESLPSGALPLRILPRNESGLGRNETW